MNNYSIVQTTEEDEFLLSVLPTKWTVQNGWDGDKNPVEGQDLCYWPRNILGYRLLEKTKKNPDVPVDEHNLRPYRCKIKRTGFQTFGEASRQLKSMESCSDTDDFQGLRHTTVEKGTAADIFKAIQTQEISSRNSQHPERNSQHPERNSQQPERSSQQPEQNSQPPERDSPPPDHSSVDHKIDELLSIVKELQTKVTTVITANQTIQDDCSQTRTLVSRLNSKVDYLATSSSRMEPSSQDVKLKKSTISPVNCLEELEALDESCKNEEFVKNAVTTLGRIRGKNRFPGNGSTVCLRVVDDLFSREFLTLCSWTGLSRSKNEDGSIIPKINFQKYERVINLFYQIVAYSDPAYSEDECRNFLHRCLQNSKQRYEEVKNMRITSSRKRRKRDPQANNTQESAADLDEEDESEGEKNGSVCTAEDSMNVKTEVPIGNEEILEEYLLE